MSGHENSAYSMEEVDRSVGKEAESGQGTAVADDDGEDDAHLKCGFGR